MYRLPFELTDSAKLLQFTILGGPQTPSSHPPLNDATVRTRVEIASGIVSYARRQAMRQTKIQTPSWQYFALLKLWYNITRSLHAVLFNIIYETFLNATSRKIVAHYNCITFIEE